MPRRNSRSPGSWAKLAQVGLGDALAQPRRRLALGRAEHLRRQRGLAGCEVALEVGGPAGGDPDGGAPRPTFGDHVDHAEVGDRRDQDLADPAEGLLDRAAPFGDRGYLLEHVEAAGDPLGPGPGAQEEDREHGRDDGEDDDRDDAHLSPSLDTRSNCLPKRE